jgi:hypothetical protein
MAKDKHQLDTVKSPEYRYDAFISYSHKDEETVEWLYDMLSGYWVPGKGSRRNIFRDDDSLSAGILNERLKTALAESRFLIVCCSQNSAESEYVNIEITEFIKNHPANNVLPCLVGDNADAETFFVPKAIEQIERELGGELFKPDLRGNPAKQRGKALRDATKQALALLAPLLDLPSKEALLDRRAKLRWWATAASIIAVIIAASLFYLSRTDWYQIWKVRGEAAKLVPQSKAPAATEWLRALALANRAKEAFDLAVEVKDPVDRSIAISAINNALTELAKRDPKLTLPDQMPQPDALVDNTTDPLATLHSIKKLRSSADDFVRAAVEFSIENHSRETRKLAATSKELAYKVQQEIIHSPLLHRALVEAARKAEGNEDAMKTALDAMLPGSVEEIFPAEILNLVISRKFGEAIAAARKIKEPDKKVQSLLVISAMAHKDGNRQAVNDAAREAYASARIIKDGSLRSTAFAAIANALNEVDEKLLAAQAADEALAIALRPGDSSSQIYNLVSLANLFIQMNDRERAGKALDGILEEAKGFKPSLFKVSYLPMAAPVIVKLGRQEEALAIIRKSQSPDDRVQSILALAKAMGESGYKNEAAHLAGEAFAMSRQVESEEDRAKALYAVAHIMSKLDKNDDTKRVADEFMAAVRKMSDPQEHDEAINGIARILSEAGKINEAFDSISRMRQDESRSKAFSALAIDAAGKQKYRLARQIADRCWVSDHRLSAYAAILLDYAKSRNPALVDMPNAIPEK